MGDGGSGGESDNVNTTTNTNTSTAGSKSSKGKTAAMDSFEVEALAEEEGSKGYSSSHFGIDSMDDQGNFTYSEQVPAGNWKNAPMKTVTRTGKKTDFTKSIMSSANPQEALYDYSNQARKGLTSKPTNAELNALEAQGLDTFGMGLRGTEAFGTKFGHDDYGTMMSRSDYKPDALNQGIDPGVSEAQRVNNPLMSGLLGMTVGLTPIGTIAKGMNALGITDQPGVAPTNTLGKITGALTMGMTNPADPGLYDASDYSQALARSASSAQAVADSIANQKAEQGLSDGGGGAQASQFSANLGGKDAIADAVANLGGGTNSGTDGTVQSPTPIANQDEYTSSDNVPGMSQDINYGNLAANGLSGIRFFSNMGRERDFGDAITEEDAYKTGFGRRLNLFGGY